MHIFVITDICDICNIFINSLLYIMSFVIFALTISVIINYIQVTLLLFKGAISV